MTTLRLAFTILFFAFLAVGCSRSEEPAAAAAGLLAHVPADTPYLAANLEPLPETVVDAYLARMQPALDEMQAQLTAARSELEADQAAAGTADDDQATRLALAVLRQLDGNLSRAGLSALGLDIVAQRVVYGLGVFPVLRMGVSNPDDLRATITRILDDAGITGALQTHQEVDFWRLTAGGQDDGPMGVYLTVRDDHFAIGVLPSAFEAELLPLFIGLEPTTGGAAATRLAELNRVHGYMPYGSGILDLHLLADQFLQAETITARAMAAFDEYDPAAITADCISEIHGIIDNVPRITAGTTEFSSAAIAHQYRVEAPATLAGQLAGLVARLPAADPASTRMLDLSFGMRIGAVRDFLREKAAAIVDDPYQCEQLQDINSSAASALTQLDQPMPPFVNNFRGVRISLTELMLGEETLPADARGQLALHVEQPEMFVGMAQMFLPDLSTLGLTPGGDPVQVPASLIPLPGLVTFAAMSTEAIGLSVGAGEEARLKDFLNREPGPEGRFLSAGYDMRAYLEHSNRMAGAGQDDGPDADAPEGDLPGAVRAIGRAAQEAYRNMADRGYASLQFDADGLVIDGRVTFKP